MSVGFLDNLIYAYDYDSETLFQYDESGQLIESEKIKKASEETFNYQNGTITGWNGSLDGYTYYEWPSVPSAPKLPDVYVLPDKINGEKVEKITGFYEAKVYGSNEVQSPTLVVVPPGVKELEQGAFRGVHFRCILLPNSMRTLEIHALSETWISDLFLPQGVESFSISCRVDLKSLALPDSCKGVGACCSTKLKHKLDLTIGDRFDPKGLNYYDVGNIHMSSSQSRFSFENGLVLDKKEEKVVFYNRDEQRDVVRVPR